MARLDANTTASSELTGLHRGLLRCDSLHFMLGYEGRGGDRVKEITTEEISTTEGTQAGTKELK